MSSGPSWRVWFRRLAPWVVTAVVLFFLLRRYSIESIAAEMARGDTTPMIPFAVLLALMSLILVGTADWFVFTNSLGGVRWWSVIKGKAATAVLMVLGYGFGHGAYGIWIARAGKTDVRTAVGLIGYIMLNDLTAVLALASGSTLIAGAALPEQSRLVLTYIAPAAALALMLLALLGPRYLGNWVRDPKVLRPWAMVRPRAYFGSLFTRIVNMSFTIFMIWCAASVFGLDIPFSAMMSYSPIIFLIGALPINIFGLGAVQAAWVFFFEPWTAGEQMIAFQFVLHIFVTVMLIVRGAPFMRSTIREIDQGRFSARLKSSATDDSVADPSAADVRESTAT